MTTEMDPNLQVWRVPLEYTLKVDVFVLSTDMQTARAVATRVDPDTLVAFNSEDVSATLDRAEIDDVKFLRIGDGEPKPETDYDPTDHPDYDPEIHEVEIELKATEGPLES